MASKGFCRNLRLVTVSQVLALNDSDLLGLRNFGQKSLDELREALTAHGYAIPSEEQPADEDGEPAESTEE